MLENVMARSSLPTDHPSTTGLAATKTLAVSMDVPLQSVCTVEPPTVPSPVGACGRSAAGCPGLVRDANEGRCHGPCAPWRDRSCRRQRRVVGKGGWLPGPRPPWRERSCRRQRRVAATGRVHLGATGLLVPRRCREGGGEATCSLPAQAPNRDRGQAPNGGQGSGYGRRLLGMASVRCAGERSSERDCAARWRKQSVVGSSVHVTAAPVSKERAARLFVQKMRLLAAAVPCSCCCRRSCSCNCGSISGSRRKERCRSSTTLQLQGRLCVCLRFVEDCNFQLMCATTNRRTRGSKNLDRIGRCLDRRGRHRNTVRNEMLFLLNFRAYLFHVLRLQL